MNQQHQIAVIGLGYVGLPVALAFAKQYPVVGYDTNSQRINELKTGNDSTHEFDSNILTESTAQFTDDSEQLKFANIYIVTVPTPIDHAKQPDFRAMIKATECIGKYLKKNDLVIYESTVYPGATEEICKPILELHSKLTAGKDFNIGYSPERINPGDKTHNFENITKIVSADCESALNTVSKLYASVVKAGVHEASSIKVAEMAKVIENTQRDINIALMNELAMICNRLNISSTDVLAAARTKWNFMDFTPGLVGGHCIGVDPYYLTYKAQQIGHHPDVILAGRRINDNMGKYIAEQTILKMIQAGSPIKNRKIAVLGFTFKENCHDIRNTKVIDIIQTLEHYNVELILHAPLANPAAVSSYYGYKSSSWEEIQGVDAIIIAVAHDCFKQIPYEEYLNKLSPLGIIIDVKNILHAKKESQVWSL